jgi:hypothetical protein
MARNHQGLQQRIAEAQRKEKAVTKRLARLARCQSKRKPAVVIVDT